jgi:uncharacterized protein
MSGPIFSWDDRKAGQNLRKHGVSFQEASTVFFDEKAIEFFDPDHSRDEDRFLLLGHSYQLRVLVVAYSFRSREAVIRLISARKATKNEQKVYLGKKR